MPTRTLSASATDTTRTRDDEPTPALDTAAMLGPTDAVLIRDAFIGLRDWVDGGGLTSPGSVGDGPEARALRADVDRLARVWAGHADARRVVPLSLIVAPERARILTAIGVLHDELDSVAWFSERADDSEPGGCAGGTLRHLARLTARLNAAS